MRDVGRVAKQKEEKRQAGLVTARDALEAALGAFREAERVGLIKPFERFLIHR
jgi:hypothetical protein